MLYFRVITKAEEELVHIDYSALNFRDVMTATGKLSVNGIVSDQLNQVWKKTIVCSHLLLTVCMNSVGLFLICLSSLNFLFL
jgi:maltodextrin utilization protein YvdJ